MKKEICRLSKNEIYDFYKLVKKVYDEYVCIDYSEKGNLTFYSYIEPKKIEERYLDGQWFYVCKNEIIGALEIRNKNHISLLFVDKKYHKQGIGRALISQFLNDLKNENEKYEYIEVNSSPYAKEIYRSLGFKIESNCRKLMVLNSII